MEHRSGCSLWFTVISIGLAVVIALGLKLPSVTLVRIGIGLDLLAAFLITPELLGVARLALLQESTQAVAGWLGVTGLRVARLTLVVAPGAIGFPLGATLAYIVVGGLSGCFFYVALRSVFLLIGQLAIGGDLSLDWLTDAILLGAFLLLSSLNLVVLGSHWLYERIDHRDPIGYTIESVGSRLLWITSLPGHFLIGITNLFIGFPALLLSRIAGALRIALEERGRIVELMVPIGIATFVVGAIYQLMGTF